MGTALVGLSVLGELPWWVTVVVLVREVGITVLRFVVIRHGVMPASRGGKVKTVLQAVAIGLYVLPLSGALARRRRAGHGARGRRHRGHRGRLRDPGPHAAPDQPAGAGQAGPAGRRWPRGAVAAEAAGRAPAARTAPRLPERTRGGAAESRPRHAAAAGGRTGPRSGSTAAAPEPPA